MKVTNGRMYSHKHLGYVHLNVVLPRMINRTTPQLTLAQQKHIQGKQAWSFHAAWLKEHK